ncbi:hypothetical protein GW916_06665 [bacterium]|nr:hypothetical protein [bacterium]
MNFTKVCKMIMEQKKVGLSQAKKEVQTIAKINASGLFENLELQELREELLESAVATSFEN